ncbi:adenylate/guanylate cyclase domain-containing protein [Bradyrhizobium prioriisuperbiae]|uniref:adenylate/guanylate cyclase domain-containing protein n=1 Tax=Bradyrhizobium prioriisuperbiae TaxID=2854389 RepID=UPI0028E78C7E|nr:adenylate/guanylate cyclase domain-containing protein [Bradyrhizobium prioritasuperba]
MRIGIRGAISSLVLASIALSAVGVHLLWWRTAQQVSQTLADTINEQIVSAVGDELQSITTEVRSAYTAVRSLLVQDVVDVADVKKREFVFLSQLQAQPTISWVAFGWPEGSFFAAHKLGDSTVEMIDIAAGQFTRRIEQYRLTGDDAAFDSRRSEETTYAVADQQWFKDAIKSDEAHWFNLTTHPVGERLAVAFAGPIDVHQQRKGVLAIIVELTRVSQFLSQLTVGKSAGAFILDRSGGVIAAPDPNADELNALKSDHPLLPVAVAAIRETGAAYDPEQGQPYRARIALARGAFEVVLTPISFPGWSLVTVVPESEFLGPVQATIRKLLIGLAALIVVAGLLSAWLAQRLVAAPLIKVVNEIKHVERFDLHKVVRHPSQLIEIENLSGAIADMALGLSAFRKYIPADLVKRLVSDGTQARLGGSVRPMTVMFIDMAGFTGMSERLGDRIIPLLSRYFEAVTLAIQAHDGTIDKFIGDAVMAFWGAPRMTSDHAVACCRAALACRQAVRDSGLTNDTGAPLHIRIGINSGDMLVGNIGSEARLNYTVIGDAVNIASRLESTNKVYGSGIIIGPQTRRLAGDEIIVRELDRLAVYGRAGELEIYELLGMSADHAGVPGWVEDYERGLASYRARDFSGAIACFRTALARRGEDEASSRMIQRCTELLSQPLADDWSDTTVADVK